METKPAKTPKLPFKIAMDYICDADLYAIARLQSGIPLSYAQFIVKCCNNFEAMKEALTMLQRYAMIRPIEGVIYPEGAHQDWIEKANQLLSQIEKDGE